MYLKNKRLKSALARRRLISRHAPPIFPEPCLPAERPEQPSRSQLPSLERFSTRTFPFWTRSALEETDQDLMEAKFAKVLLAMAEKTGRLSLLRINDGFSKSRLHAHEKKKDIAESLWKTWNTIVVKLRNQRSGTRLSLLQREMERTAQRQALRLAGGARHEASRRARTRGRCGEVSQRAAFVAPSQTRRQRPRADRGFATWEFGHRRGCLERLGLRDRDLELLASNRPVGRGLNGCRGANPLLLTNLVGRAPSRPVSHPSSLVGLLNRLLLLNRFGGLSRAIVTSSTAMELSAAGNRKASEIYKHKSQN